MSRSLLPFVRILAAVFRVVASYFAIAGYAVRSRTGRRFVSLDCWAWWSRAFGLAAVSVWAGRARAGQDAARREQQQGRLEGSRRQAVEEGWNKALQEV